MSPIESRVSSRLENLRKIYGAPYFHGFNSGYPQEGYAAHHPDWVHWLDRIATQVRPGSRWLDLGCAYGFLVERARSRGYRAVGCDISRYALTQNVALRGVLAEADGLQLPFRSESMDLITAFDVLEHLDFPEQAVAEIHRCLAPRGLAIIATPDPCRLGRTEPTHVSEHPPVHWILLLQKQGFNCDFGFEGADYNFVLAASKAENRVESFHKCLFEGNLLDVVSGQSAPICGRIRQGFHASGPGWILGDCNEIYVFNPLNSPISLSLEFSARTSGHSGILLVLADGRVVHEVEFFSENTDLRCRQEGLIFSAGGHSLRLEPAQGGGAGQITVESIRLQARPAEPETLVSLLPFDLFERYQVAALLCRRLPSPPGAILDYGGYIGDQGGHWADASDFGLAAVFTDVRPADSPRYIPIPALRDGEFDMVLALDVLEHISAAERGAFLDRLDRLSRNYLLIAGPFASAETEEAEQSVREGLLRAGVSTHGFLSEHSKNGLPARNEILAWVREREYSVCELHGMSVSMWEVLQRTSLVLSHYQQYRTLEKLNQSINRRLWTGAGAPYRRFLLISKQHQPEVPFEDLQSADEPAELLDFLRREPEILSARAVRRRDGALFLLNETGRHVQLLLRQAEELKQRAEELQRQAEDLARLLETERQRPLADIAWHRLRRRICERTSA